MSDDSGDVYIDFSFFIPYDEALLDANTLQNAIAHCINVEQKDVHIYTCAKHPTGHRIQCKGWLQTVSEQSEPITQQFKKSVSKRELSKKLKELRPNVTTKIKVSGLHLRYTTTEIIGQSEINLHRAKDDNTNDTNDQNREEKDETENNEEQADNNDEEPTSGSTGGLQTYDGDEEENFVVVEPSPNNEESFEKVNNEEDLEEDEVKTDDDFKDDQEDKDDTEDKKLVDSRTRGHLKLIQTQLEKERSNMNVLKSQYDQDTAELHNRIAALKRKLELEARQRQETMIDLEIDDDLFKKKVSEKERGLRNQYLQKEQDLKQLFHQKIIEIEKESEEKVRKWEKKFNHSLQLHHLEIENIRLTNEEQLNNMKSRVKDLEKQTKQQSNKDKLIESLHTQLEDKNNLLEQTKNDYESVLERTRIENKEELENELKLHTENLDKTRHELRKLKKEVMELHTNTKRQQQTIKQHNNEKDTLLQEIESLRIQIGKEQNLRYSKETQLDSLKRQIEKLKKNRDKDSGSDIGTDTEDEDLQTDPSHLSVKLGHKKSDSLHIRQGSRILIHDNVILVQEDKNEDETNDDQQKEIKVEYDNKKSSSTSNEYTNNRIKHLENRIKVLEEANNELKESHLKEVQQLQQELIDLKMQNDKEHEEFYNDKERLKLALKHKDKLVLQTQEKYKTMEETNLNVIKAKDQQINNYKKDINSKEEELLSLRENIDLLQANIDEYNRQLLEIEAQQENFNMDGNDGYDFNMDQIDPEERQAIVIGDDNHYPNNSMESNEFKNDSDNDMNLGVDSYDLPQVINTPNNVTIPDNNSNNNNNIDDEPQTRIVHSDTVVMHPNDDENDIDIENDLPDKPTHRRQDTVSRDVYNAKDQEAQQLQRELKIREEALQNLKQQLESVTEKNHNHKNTIMDLQNLINRLEDKSHEMKEKLEMEVNLENQAKELLTKSKTDQTIINKTQQNNDINKLNNFELQKLQTLTNNQKDQIKQLKNQIAVITKQTNDIKTKFYESRKQIQELETSNQNLEKEKLSIAETKVKTVYSLSLEMQKLRTYISRMERRNKQLKSKLKRQNS